MKSPFYWDPTRWNARGYFAPAAPKNDPTLQGIGDVPFWLEMQEVLAQAKAGDFEGIERLLDIYQATAQSHLLPWVCAQVLGDAGTPRCFSRMVREMDDSLDPNLAGNFCHSFQSWGSLSSVPAIVQAYDRHFGWQKMNSVPLLLSTLLEPEWGPLSRFPKEEELIAYEDRVLERYEELKQRLGTDQIILLHGERFSVASVAQRMFRGLNGGDFERAMRPFYRRRFEASTGIDCSGFYKDEEFQPLTAAAILEDFLESPEAARYEEGVRYFFGHRIPE